MDVEPPVDTAIQEVARPPSVQDSDDDMDHFGGPPSVGGQRLVVLIEY